MYEGDAIALFGGGLLLLCIVLYAIRSAVAAGVRDGNERRRKDGDD